MKIIEELSDKIEKEIKCAEEYAKCALAHKEDNLQLAEIYYKKKKKKMVHMNLLHTQVTLIIEDYRKKNGEPPEAMKVLYNILHRKHIENAAAVKGMLALYKE